MFKFSFEFELFCFFCQKSMDIFFFFLLNKIYFISDYCLKYGFYCSLFMFFEKIYLYNACFIKKFIFILLNIMFIIIICVISFLVFFIILIKENILYYDKNFLKQFKFLYDEYKWKFYYKFVRDSILKKKQGILFFNLELEDRPTKFKVGFKFFFYKFKRSLINFFFLSKRERYKIWKWASYVSKKPSLRYNKHSYSYNISPEMRSYKEKKLFYYQYNRYNHKTSLMKMFLKPNLTFLDSLYIFLVYREEYAAFLAKEQTKMELDNIKDKLKEKLKERLGARLYRKLSSRKDQKQAMIVRMKLNSADSFKEILSKDEISSKNV